MSTTPARFLLAAGAAIALCLPALAQNTVAPTKVEPKAAQPEKAAPTLKAGDLAPALSVENWVKGDAVTGFEKGRVYVVEFWATWCGPCIASIPHLTEIQKTHKGKVQIIGVSGSDKDLATVEKFVKEKGDKMGYTVAYDGDKSMSNTWMKPAGKNGIPCSFIVDRESKIAWIGHPAAGLDTVLDKVVAGTFNATAWAATETKANDLRKKAYEAGEAEDYAAAGKALDELAAIDQSFAADAGMMKFRMMLLKKKDYEAASATASTLLAGPVKNNAESLNEIAWTILDAPGVEKRDTDLALKIALRAVEIEKGENGMILDTLARAYWEKGDKAKAIETQRKAVEKAGSPDLKTELEATLAKYEGK